MEGRHAGREGRTRPLMIYARGHSWWRGDRPRRPSQDGTNWTWLPKPIVSERHKSRDEAERRSVEIAKQMIDRGKFRPEHRSRFP